MNNPKWADYVITAVAYNLPRTHIVQVQVCEHVVGHNYNYLTDPPLVFNRETVATLIAQGRSVITATLSSGSNTWTQGAKVERILVNNVYYIRTDQNSRASDNLGSLPEVQPA